MMASKFLNLFKNYWIFFRLKDGPKVEERPFPNYLKRFENNNVQFIDIVFSKEKMNKKSYENEAEG